MWCSSLWCHPSFSFSAAAASKLWSSGVYAAKENVNRRMKFAVRYTKYIRFTIRFKKDTSRRKLTFSLFVEYVKRKSGSCWLINAKKSSRKSRYSVNFLWGPDAHSAPCCRSLFSTLLCSSYHICFVIWSAIKKTVCSKKLWLYMKNFTFKRFNIYLYILKRVH